MPVTFVTALFLPEGANADVYLNLALWIVTANIPLIVYTTPNLATLMRETWRGRVSHIRFIEDVSMEDYWERDVILPEKRNHEKDTAFYMSVQLAKLKVCAHAASIVETDLLCWLDCGIFKISQNKGRFWLTLKSLACTSGISRILSPGGYDSQPTDLLGSVRWKTLGGVLLGPKDQFRMAYEQQTQLVETHLPRLSWEVNYWAMLTEEGFFDLYPADHNDSILLNLVSRLATGPSSL